VCEWQTYRMAGLASNVGERKLVYAYLSAIYVSFNKHTDALDVVPQNFSRKQQVSS